ncbi:MAG: Fic family protein [Smithella sp.]|nr:Fic family protein [Smithella sp.]
MDFKPKYTITDAITNGLTAIERARGFLQAATISDEWVKAMAKRALLLETFHTTHIEGAHLTLKQAETLLAGKDVPDADPDDKRELLNYKRAFEFVEEYIADGGPITEGLIREIHKKLVAGVRGGSAAPGEYRKLQNYVVNAATKEVVYTPPPAHDVPAMMAEMVGWINEATGIHPVLMSGIAQYQLVHIHPFLDGNGRASRLLSTLCLYRAGYDFKRLFTISEFYDQDRGDFYQAIRKVRENDMDMTCWIEYFVAGLSTQMQEVAKRGEQAIRADVLTREKQLNGRQAKALRFMLEHEAMGIHDYGKLCRGVNRKTLQRDLKDMIDKGIVKTEGKTSSLVYRVG